LDFICKRCNQKYHENTQRQLICAYCDEDLNLLEKQLDVNSKRIKKLEEHRRSVEPELKSKPEDHIIVETLRRLDHNLQIEYKQRDGIIKAINSKETF